VHVLVNGVRLFFDVEGVRLVPDGPANRGARQQGAVRPVGRAEPSGGDRDRVIATMQKDILEKAPQPSASPSTDQRR